MSRTFLSMADVRCFIGVLLSLAAMFVTGELKGQERPAPPVNFYDIPPQALDRALNAYIGLSGAQVFYETSIVAGLRSMGANGNFTQEAALGTLLAGSGLVAVRTDVDAFVISVASDNDADPQAAGNIPDIHFLGALQTGVLRALCGNPKTRPGDYKIGLELWIAPSGSIYRSVLIGSTGNSARDALMIDTLRNVALGVAPPPNLPQPIVLTVAQKSPRQTGDCSG